MLSNIYLDDFDQEMARREHQIIRYADDILLFKWSCKGAENALEVASSYLENELKLTVTRCPVFGIYGTLRGIIAAIVTIQPLTG